MEIIAQKFGQANLNIKDILESRLSYFSNQGLNSRLFYLAQTSELTDLNIHHANFNRIIFNTLSFLHENNKSNEVLKVTVKNSSTSLMIRFSFSQLNPYRHIGMCLPSLKNGFSLLSPRRKTQSSFLAVQSLVRESGGSFSLISLSSRNPSYCLQIPLSPPPNQNNCPPPKETRLIDLNPPAPSVRALLVILG